MDAANSVRRFGLTSGLSPPTPLALRYDHPFITSRQEKCIVRMSDINVGAADFLHGLSGRNGELPLTFAQASGDA
jgi:hypothetical protein